MSLLMDALRKAEQEKKAAARRLREQNKPEGETDAASSSDELTLVPDDRLAGSIPGEETAEQQASVAATESTEALQDNKGLDKAHKERSKLSLSPLDEGSDRIDLASPSGDGGEQSPSVASELGEDTQDGLTAESKAPAVDTPGSDQWIAPQPDEPLSRTDENERPGPALSISPVDRDDDTLRDTVQDARLTPTVAGTIDGEAGAGRGYSPATAQSVFAARKKNTNYTFNTAVVVIALAVVAAFAYGVVAYYAVTPVVPDLPSPTVARGVEQVDAPPVLPVEPVREFDPAETVALIEPAVSPAPAELPEPPVAVDTTEPADETVTTDEPAVEAPVTAAAAETDTAALRSATAVQPGDAEDMLELKPALLRISRSQVAADKSARAVNDAYLAYRQGRYDTAGALYAAVLAENPEHRDALLGMAAIAMRSQQYERAFDYYMRLLRQNPVDRVAQTAVISLQTHADPVASESRIRLLLEDAPEAPYLHFTLGNLYASQSRWPDAQQAFFDAFRLDSGNPDYAHNLAVSLDRLGQPRAARDYYRRALELADTRDVNFDTAQVSLRLQALSVALDSQ